MAAETGKYRKLASRLISLVVIAVIFFFMAKNLCNNWSKISGYEWDINYPLLAVSVLMVGVLNVLFAFGWILILRQLGANLPFIRGFRIHLLSQLGKYVPGKIWLVVGKIYLAEKEGVSRRAALASSVFENALIIISGMFIAVLYITLAGVSEVRYLLLPAVIVIACGLAALHPSVFNRLANWGLKRIRRSPIDFRIGYRNVLALLGYYFLYWLALGTAFFLFFRSIFPIPLAQFPQIIGVVAISVLAGFLSMLTPGGLGIREGLMALLLANYVPQPIAVVLSFAHRIWLTICEVLLTGIIVRIAGKPPEQPPAKNSGTDTGTA